MIYGIYWTNETTKTGQFTDLSYFSDFVKYPAISYLQFGMKNYIGVFDDINMAYCARADLAKYFEWNFIWEVREIWEIK